jgi:hypothetical protein
MLMMAKRGAAKPQPDKRRGTSVYLGDDYDNAMDFVHEITRLKKTEIIRVALEKYFVELGVWPWPPEHLPETLPHADPRK